MRRNRSDGDREPVPAHIRATRSAGSVPAPMLPRVTASLLEPRRFQPEEEEFQSRSASAPLISRSRISSNCCSVRSCSDRAARIAAERSHPSLQFSIARQVCSTAIPSARSTSDRSRLFSVIAADFHMLLEIRQMLSATFVYGSIRQVSRCAARGDSGKKELGRG